MIINYSMKAIELTKGEEKNARKFGSEMYEQLKAARSDYPEFRIVIKKTAKRSNDYKGLTYSFMEKYIIDQENEEALSDYYVLIGKDASEDEECEVASYLDVKAWFLAKFPEFEAHRKEQKTKIADILKKVA